jgi:hypothetical protein
LENPLKPKFSEHGPAPVQAVCPYEDHNTFGRHYAFLMYNAGVRLVFCT